MMGLLGLLSVVPGRQGLADAAMQNAEQQQQRTRFEGVGLELIVDAVPGADLKGVEFYADDALRPFFSPAVLTAKTRHRQAFGGPVPLKVRVVWRTERVAAQIPWGSAHHYDDQGRGISRPGVYAPAYQDDAKEIAKRQTVSTNTGVPHHGPWGSDYRSEVVGDYTVAVASRIPDDLLRELRARPGSLRLKFRLKTDGVMFGWDVERDGAGTGYVLRRESAGGDFKEARIFGGKPVEPGWELRPDGSRVSTDY